MRGFDQKFFWSCRAYALSALLIYVQLSLWARPAESISQSQRIAVLDISHAKISQAQRNAITTALAKICREEFNFEIISASSLSTYLKKHPGFSIFVTDRVQALCQALKLEYLMVLAVERPAELAESSGDSLAKGWRFTLRWLEGSSGQITKIHSRECAGDLNAPESFPLHDLLDGLLTSPDIIVAVDSGPVEMLPPEAWSPQVSVPVPDSSSITMVPQNRRGRHWLWYVGSAAMITGGSAALLLHQQDRAPGSKPLLPEPPAPPK